MKERESSQQNNADERSRKDNTSIRSNEKQEIHDYPEISKMDKREGNLEHGETGGGFFSREKEENNRD